MLEKKAVTLVVIPNGPKRVRFFSSIWHEFDLLLIQFWFKYARMSKEKPQNDESFRKLKILLPHAMLNIHCTRKHQTMSTLHSPLFCVIFVVHSISLPI